MASAVDKQPAAARLVAVAAAGCLPTATSGSLGSYTAPGDTTFPITGFCDNRGFEGWILSRSHDAGGLVRRSRKQNACHTAHEAIRHAMAHRRRAARAHRPRPHQIRTLRPRMGTSPGRCRYSGQRQQLRRLRHHARRMNRISRAIPASPCQTHARADQPGGPCKPEGRNMRRAGRVVHRTMVRCIGFSRGRSAGRDAPCSMSVSEVASLPPGFPLLYSSGAIHAVP